MTKTSKKLMIKSRSGSPLKLNESASVPNKKYVFEGIFTACSTDDHVVVNRNNRIYPEDEVLRHLKYLREEIKNNGGMLLGEADHPADRFDVSIKEAAVATEDLWYDFENHNLMGRMRILDTPNGKILKTLVDEGYPLYVSSRAAGSVDPDSHKVSIERIFTYDGVTTPGFQEAQLQRVMESCESNTLSYLTESYNAFKTESANAQKLGLLAEGVSISETEIDCKISESVERMKKMAINKEELSKRLFEDEEVKPTEEKTEDVSDEYKLPTADLNPATVEEGDDKSSDSEEKKDDNTSSEETENKEEKKEDDKTLTDEEKAEKRKKILGVEVVDAEGKSNTEAEKEAKRAEILDVETKPADEETEDSESESDEEKNDEETKPAEECDAQTKPEEECGNGCNGDDCKPEEECGKDCNGPDCTPNDIKVKDAKKTADDVKDKSINDEEKATDIKKKTEDDMDKYERLLKKAKKLADVKESIVKAFPFAISLSDENFAKFAALKVGEKNKVHRYILEHNIFSVADINEHWKTPLLEERRQLKNWLRLASDEDKRLFAEAPVDVQDAIEESAKLVVIQTKQDADAFWNKTGLRQAAAHKIINESMKERYAVATKDEAQNVTILNENAANLGYSMNYFKMIEDMFC